jgi:hypothetical protein
MAVRSFERFEDDALNLIIIGGVTLGAVLLGEAIYKGYKIEQKVEGAVKAVIDEGEKIAYQAKDDAEVALNRIEGKFYNLKTIEQNQQDRSAKSSAWEAYKRTLGFLLAPGLAFESLAHDTITGEITWPGYVIRSAEAVPGEVKQVVEESLVWRMATGGEMTDQEIEAEFPISSEVFSGSEGFNYGPGSFTGVRGTSQALGFGDRPSW